MLLKETKPDAGEKARARWVYPAAFVFLVIGVASALAGRFETSEDTSGSPAESASASAPASAAEERDRVPSPPPLPDDFVPDLPEVPDLALDPPPPRPVAEGPAPDLAEEIRLLDQAGRAMAEHPASALTTLAQHRREHPRGALAEEREALAIETLLALGRELEAERRYFDFRRAYPESSSLPRLERRLRAP